MRVLVTGGAGFIGSHFIREWLRRHPSDALVNLDALTYAASHERLRDVISTCPRYQMREGNVCDPGTVRDAMRGCDIVIHFAAETHVDRSITDAAPFIRTNVEGTVVVLNEAKAQGVRRVLHVSTDEVYGPILQGAVNELAPLAPRSPYAASKAAGDLLAQAFHHTHDVPTIVVRPTNIFGPAQFPEKFIPLCVTCGLEGASIPLYGDGQQRRAWLFITDLCAALQVILEQGDVGAVYNIAGESEHANHDTAKKILDALQVSPQLLQCVADRPGHDRRYAMDDAKLRALGWWPRTSFDQGIAQTLAWYRAHEAWWRPLTQGLREDPYHWLNRTPRTRTDQPVGAVL